MISDEPDEDADALDDDVAMESLLDEVRPKANGDHSTTRLPDWPPRSGDDLGLALDAETLAWFKAGHADWRCQIRSVLRAWVIAKDAAEQTAGLLPDTKDARHDDRP